MIPAVLLRLFGFASFLATIAVIGVGIAVALWAVLNSRPVVLQRAAMTVGLWVMVYALAVALGPLLASSRQIAPGEELSFCGLDCHLHISVTSVALDDGLTVTLRLRSDARRAAEFPSHLRIRAIDATGRAFAPVEGRLPDPLDAGDTITRTLHFDVPRGASPNRLVMSWGDWEDYVIPGPENAMVQQRRSIALAAGPNRAS